MAAKESAQSVKVLDELMQQLNISKDAAEVRGSSLKLASFINGPIQDFDVPIK